MAMNGPVTMSYDSTLANPGAESNVATNQANAALAASANVDGKDISPTSVTAQTLNLGESLRVGSGVTLTDGCIVSKNLSSGSVTADKLNATDVVATQLSLSGNLSAFGIANLGTITGGSLSIAAAGNVSIGNGAAGLSLSSNALRTIVGGVPTITVDGATGTITASKFVLTADGTSSVDLRNAATSYFPEGIIVGTTTLGGIKSTAEGAQSTADSAIKPGGGVAVDGSKYITTINMSSGIQIYSSTGTAKTQLTSAGMAIYNSAGTLVVQADHSNGVWVNNASGTPGLTERLSLAYGGTEHGYIYAGYDTAYYLALVAASTEKAYIIFPGGLQIQNDVAITSGGAVKAIHKTAAGYNKADTTFTFVDGSAKTHTVTFTDGLITSWAAA